MSFRIVLISLGSDVWAMGLRQISACLKKAGWDTCMIFLPSEEERFYMPQPHQQDYDPTLLKQVCDLSAGADLVGISLMSNFVGRARSLTDAIHSHLSIPVIWGGIHPTVKPDECLNWADFVCIGEGEKAVVELVNCMVHEKDCRNVPNIWMKDDSQMRISNAASLLDHSLDELPLPDYDLDQ